MLQWIILAFVIANIIILGWIIIILRGIADDVYEMKRESWKWG